jgi:glutamine amidotransferase PdxT
MSAVKIGVLALQGAFSEHVAVFNSIPGVTAIEVYNHTTSLKKI